MGGSITITGSCTGSRRHICVTIASNGNYELNNGGGPVPNGGLVLNAGTQYVFEGQGDEFKGHPFALTLSSPLTSSTMAASSSPSWLSSSGGSSFQPIIDGVDGDNPIADDDQKLLYTPSVVGPTNVYYQSASSLTKGFYSFDKWHLFTNL
jgi:hypothetical protein